MAIVSMFSLVTTLADLVMLWVFVAVSRYEDRAHPLATLVAVSTGPYFLSMCPRLVETALFGYDAQQVHDVRETSLVWQTIHNRDTVFKSIMLCTYTLFVVYNAFFVAFDAVFCVRHDRTSTSSQLSLRTGIACAVAVVLSVAAYNFGPDPHPTEAVFLFIGHASLLMTLAWAWSEKRSVEVPTENRIEAARNITSLAIYVIVVSVPLGFIEFEMLLNFKVRYVFAFFESYVRFMLYASIVLLEPYNSRFRFYDRFYRTTHRETPVAPAPRSPSQTVPQQPVITAQPLPQKMPLPDMLPVYDSPAPPSYDTARDLPPTTWTITPPSKVGTGVRVEMTPVETH